MGQLITAGFGKANLSNVLATYSSMKVTAPFMRTTAINSGKTHGQKIALPVGRADHHGILLSQHVEHDNGTIIMVQASWKRNGSPIRDGALFVRLRAGAPLYNIIAKVPIGEQNIVGDSFMIFSGYADIMSLDDLQDNGIEVNGGFIRRFIQMDELEECFRISMMAPETVPRPQLTEVEGQNGPEMQPLAAPPLRRISLRKR